MKPVSKNLQKIFNKYPYDKILRDSCIAILEKIQPTKKAREQLTMQVSGSWI